MLKGKSVLLGVTGGIAAYKMAGVCSRLIKLHADTDVIMTENACHFITPITFESLTSHKCMTDTFDRNFQFDIKHISMAQKADVLLIAPATANVIGKLANGIADDMLTTTALACTCEKIIAPAMNTNMFTNQIVQDNLEKLRNYGWTVIPPDSGRLACGSVGTGKMPSEDVLVSYILKAIACEKDYTGKKVLITAGATQEALDPVRYITNHSTGKMGYAAAYRAMLRGADVTLVTGRTAIEPPPFVETIQITSAEDMYNAVTERFSESDVAIMAAAVADYTPENFSENKIKKHSGDMCIPLKRTKDILSEICKSKRDNQFVCGFSMETENLIENSRRKLETKNCNMIAANSLKCSGAGFGTDTNVITLITKDNIEELPIMSKEDAADRILDTILKQI
ncbi:MAG: bifunctional phosphopantothenoylcysteine decarboxylase/phosphopantothenate--cysteine ligase CoaBC [Oscillospiraceae bacterium]